ncbi:MAG: hypothetical protein IAE81_19550 [Caldilineaceae bacterium]|jgi:hypothetical protein|nr:hypothetical protein [Caldilineaceae bacterium]
MNIVVEGCMDTVKPTSKVVKMSHNARLWLVVLAGAWLLAACGGGEAEPTRTPIPTWTPTPVGAAPAEAVQADAPPPVVQAGPAQPGEQAADPTQIAAAIATDTPTPTPIPTDTATPEPTATPTETPTATPSPPPTATPAPTDTPTPEPSPTPTPEPAYPFALEETVKFPTESLAPNVVRIFAYVYSPAEFGLGDYSLRVEHDGARLVVDEVSSAGLPAQTREDVSPYTRFTNFNVVFVEPQAGTWRVQLLDPQGQPAGPEASFELAADENTRELYVRYAQK